MSANAASWLAEEKPAHMIEVSLHRPHALEHRRALRRRKPTDDHVTHFSLGVTADDRQHETTAQAQYQLRRYARDSRAGCTRTHTGRDSHHTSPKHKRGTFHTAPRSRL